jgi:hypothetical protein
MVAANRLGQICLSLDEIIVLAGHEVLMKFDENGPLIIGDPQGILGQQLRLHTIHLLNIITCLNTSHCTRW